MRIFKRGETLRADLEEAFDSLGIAPGDHYAVTVAPRLTADSCLDCGEGIANAKTAWAEVIGWERPRSQGGTNHVALRQPTGRVRCGSCMNARQHGVDPVAQGRLG